MMVASIAIQAYSVAGLWRSISWRACAPFLIGGMAAMPLGIYALLNLRPQAYAVTMGVALTLYGAYMLFRRPRHSSAAACWRTSASERSAGSLGRWRPFPEHSSPFGAA